MKTIAAVTALTTLSLLAGCGGGAHATPGSTRIAFSNPQKVGYARGDDWEPALIAERFGHLYVAFAHADTAREKKGTYHTRMLLQRSDDGGMTWNPPTPLAPPARKFSEGQFDPWFTLGPDGHTLAFGFLQGYPRAPVDIVTSTDLGKTWSMPMQVSSLSPPLDKVVLVSRGPVVAYGYTDYHSHIIASISTDSGATWTTHVISTLSGLTSESQVLVSGGGIDSRDDIFFTWDAVWGPNHKPGPAAVWITKSSNRGSSWTTTSIATSGMPQRCRQCQDKWFFAPQMTMAVGSDDTRYLLWNATTPSEGNRNGGVERIYLATSTDHGSTFLPPREVSDAPSGTTHCFPALTSGSPAGDVRLAWMDTRTGSWNVYYHRSADGGATLSSPSIQLSSASAASFGIPYGDYMQLTVDDLGMTHAAWGEDTNQNNPGNVWITNETR